MIRRKTPPTRLLTTEEVTKSRKSIWFIVEGYISRWLVEDAIRFIKQSYKLEDIRVLSYQRLQNMMALVLAAIYFWLFQRLWNLDPQGWLFIVVLSTLNLIMAVVTIIGNTPWQAMLPALVINGLILLYGLLPGTKDAFGIPNQ